MLYIRLGLVIKTPCMKCLVYNCHVMLFIRPGFVIKIPSVKCSVYNCHILD